MRDELLARHRVDLVQADRGAPGVPATAGPKSLPTWWNSRFSTIAVMLPRVMPLPKMICAQSGTALATSGWAVTSMARPTLVPTMTTLRWSWKSTRDSVWMPDDGDGGEHRQRRAAEHRVRDAGDDRRRPWGAAR